MKANYQAHLAFLFYETLSPLISALGTPMGSALQSAPNPTLQTCSSQSLRLAWHYTSTEPGIVQPNRTRCARVLILFELCK